MLSYRHSFHAGNYADVLKHLVLVELLIYMQKKEGAYQYIDCHGGAGMYRLAQKESQKLREYEQGIGRIIDLDWPELDSYLSLIKSFNRNNKLEIYPGSPLLALAMMRRQDQAWLYELHPADYDLLCRTTAKYKRVVTRKEDSLKMFPTLLPPACRRSLVLLDPSFEIKSDYSTVVKSLQIAHRRFSSGVYALWYPVVDRRQIDKLERNLLATGIRHIQRFELGVCPDNAATGMTSSGIMVINPTWGLFDKMAQILPKLADIFGNDGLGQYRCDVLADE